VREPLSTAVSVLPGELPLRGYVVVKASLDGVRSSLVTEWNDHAIVVPGQLAFGRDRFEYPFFVFGAGYETVLNLINTASQRVARVTVTPLAPDGAVLGGAVPEVFEIPPQEMFDLDFRSAFGTDTGLRTGSFSVAIDRSDVGPFGSIPRIVGTILLSTADSTSVAPLLGDTVMETFFVPTAELVNTYTGLAVYNDGTAAATVEVQAINADGVLMGSATYAVAPKRLDSRLLREIVPESLGHQDGSVRIVTTSPQVRVVAFQGRLDTGELLRLNQSVVP
jgi:hypothetical protein